MVRSKLDDHHGHRGVMSGRQRVLMALGAVVAFVVPIVFSIYLARVQFINSQARYASNLARSALVQVELTVDQLAAASRAINALPEGDACAAPGLNLMRKIDLESTLLQAVGVIDGETLRCSSFAGNRPYSLGPADYISSNGAFVRAAVAIIEPESRYVVVQVGAAATIIHPDLALSLIQNDPAIAVAAFSWSQRQLLLLRGRLPPGIFERHLIPGAVRRSDGSTLAVVRSTRADVGTLVLLSPQMGWGAFSQSARTLVLAGFVSGLIMAALFVLAARNRASMRGMIRNGLARGHFALHYQPIVALETGKIVAIEALLRWNRAEGREISPDIFIPVAEQRGLMPALTARVFELLEQDLPGLQKMQPDIEVAVNLTAADLHRSGFAATIEAFIDRAGLSPCRLIIEITERTLLDRQLAEPSLTALRKTGVRVAIDDFGTGYSSLAYLAVMDIDILKIDKLFIHALGTDSATSQVTQGVIEMARALDLVTIAEGIETAGQEDIARALGVQRGQGYHFSPPLPAAQLAAVLRESATECGKVRSDLA